MCAQQVSSGFGSGLNSQYHTAATALFEIYCCHNESLWWIGKLGGWRRSEWEWEGGVCVCGVCIKLLKLWLRIQSASGLFKEDHWGKPDLDPIRVNDSIDGGITAPQVYEGVGLTRGYTRTHICCFWHPDGRWLFSSEMIWPAPRASLTLLSIIFPLSSSCRRETKSCLFLALWPTSTQTRPDRTDEEKFEWSPSSHPSIHLSVQANVSFMSLYREYSDNKLCKEAQKISIHALSINLDSRRTFTPSMDHLI